MRDNKKFKVIHKYSVIRTKRKTVSLVITPDLKILVKAPLNSNDAFINDFIVRKYNWINKQIQYFKDFVKQESRRRYISGESHYYLGIQYMLEIEDGDNSVHTASGRLVVRTDDKRKVEKILVTWKIENAKKIFDERYTLVKKLFNYRDYPTLEVRRMNKRWGSYRSSGSIALNLKLINTPVESIDYVLIHELCHHKYMNHGKEFYALLGKKLPDWKEQKKKLETYSFISN